MRGFSLIELMVSISIIVLVLSIVVANQGRFNNASLLRSQAYELALDLRQVQQRAINIQSDTGTPLAFGVHFDTDDTPDDQGAFNGSYMIFEDTNGNGFLNTVSGGDIVLRTVRLDSRFEIADIVLGDGTVTIDDGTSNGGNNLSISYQRPNFDARFKRRSGGGFDGYSSVLIHIRPRGTAPADPANPTCIEQRSVEVTSAGQIAVLEC